MYMVPHLYYTLVINVCYCTYMYIAHLHSIIYAIDHLRPTPPFTSTTINHKGLLNMAQDLFQDGLAAA